LVIKRIEHVSINVADIEKATKFYRDILGFNYIETVHDSDGPKELVYFDIAGTARLELFNFHGKALKPAPVDNGIEPLGYVHLAFEVDSVDEWAEHLKTSGVTLVYGPIN